ncbi:Glycerol-3-phosphate acyltransferase 1, mitochondrial [Varanus komodoensis]|nr:Glycerol-3-phosphate acyltransferase 1, mitochondrial [Varanus komodoensis]
MDDAALSLGAIDVSYSSSSAECTVSRCKHSSEEWGECNSRPTVFRSATLKWKENILGRNRPFVGRCCYICTPQSWDKFFNASIPSLGLRNVIYINETHTRRHFRNGHTGLVSQGSRGESADSGLLPSSGEI